MVFNAFRFLCVNTQQGVFLEWRGSFTLHSEEENMLAENIVLADGAHHMEFVQESLFSTTYWIVVIICGIIWFMGLLPAFKDSDMMALFKGIAKFGFAFLVILYFAVTYWI